MVNYDGTYEVRIFYTTVPPSESAMEHVQTIDVLLDEAPQIGDSFAGINTARRNLSVGTLDADFDVLLDFIRDFHAPTTNFIRAELWKYAPEPSQDAQFVSVYELGLAGTQGTNSVPAAQNTLTLRTQLGGIMRVQMMETNFMNNSKDSVPFARTQATVLAGYLTGLVTPFVGRDNSYPIAAAYFSETQNEKLYRKRYR